MAYYAIGRVSRELVFQMSFRRFVRILVTRWKIAVTALLACMAGAAFITVVQTRQYEASATVLISFSGASDLNELYSGTVASQERLSSYAKIAGGRAVVERAISQLQLPISADDVLNELTVDFALKSMLFTISVKDADPERAAALVGAIAEQFGAIVPTLGVNSLPPVATDQRPVIPVPATSPDPNSPRGLATIVEPPQVPVEPVSPIPVRNMAVGLVAGLLLAIAVALIRESSDRTVRSRDELEEFSGLPVLAELSEKRARSREFGADADFGDAARGLAVRLRRMLGPDGRRLLVAAPVGGEGTTTTALALACALAEIGEGVLLIEGDSGRPVLAGMLNVESSEGLADATGDSANAAKAVKSTAVPKLSLLASKSVSTVTSLCSAYPAEAVDDLLAGLSSRFDRIVVDGPPVLATVDASVLAGAVQAAVLVVRAGHTMMIDVTDAMSTLRAANTKVIGIVLTGSQPSLRNRAAAQNYRTSASSRT
jgi:capsular exopolysaccharide synthesis family protein